MPNWLLASLITAALAVLALYALMQVGIVGTGRHPGTRPKTENKGEIEIGKISEAKEL